MQFFIKYTVASQKFIGFNIRFRVLKKKLCKGKIIYKLIHRFRIACNC